MITYFVVSMGCGVKRREGEGRDKEGDEEGEGGEKEEEEEEEGGRGGRRGEGEVRREPDAMWRKSTNLPYLFL